MWNMMMGTNLVVKSLQKSLQNRGQQQPLIIFIIIFVCFSFPAGMFAYCSSLLVLLSVQVQGTVI